MFFVTFIVLLLTLFIIYLYNKRLQQMSTLKRLGIPGPQPNFILGNVIEIAREGPHNIFPKWTKKYGPIVGFYFGGRPQVLISDLDLIRQVMIKDFHLFSDRHQIVPGGIHPQPQLQKTIGWGRGNLWRKLRSTMLPSFSLSKVKAMEPLMISSIENTIIDLEDKAKHCQEVDLKPIAEELTFSIATKCIMGLNLSLNRMNKETRGLLKVVRPQFESILLAAMVLFPSLTFIAYPLRFWWETIRFKMLWSPEGAPIYDVTDFIILHGKKNLLVANILGVGFDVVRKCLQVRKAAKTESKDLLQLLIELQQIEPTTENDLGKISNNMMNEGSNVASIGRLPEEMIISNVIMLVLAAFESTSLTLQFMIHNLVNHQDIQEKLRNELKEAVASNSGTLNLTTLSKVRLLNHVIKETLRIYPPGTFGMGRVSECDYEYQGYRIPKGTGVYIDLYSIHNDPEYWPEPEKFKPERFEKEFNKLAYLPFSIGPRNCIGMQFAYMELQLTLASLIIKYKFEPGPSTENNIELSKTSFVLTPKNSVFCKVFRV